ncbi:ASCH domain-containing protein [Microbacterium sp. EST19A]|uniref:ASCH domain-containing protein n=1 Tax=Microbacterium sp. EST19A TaxID=2862681 RepID=UPI001CBEAEDA|nr:ASCH domain-containing protein [Microbacterium sp. EST19A]
MTRALFLSIKPRYARAILEGRKTIEVRRKFPDLPAGTTIVLYSSSPERAIVGTVRLKQASKLPPDRVWELHSDAIDIPEDALGEYLQGTDASTLLEVERPRAWERPVSLASLRDLLGFGPPQSFRYLDSLQVELIASSGLSVNQ